MKFTIVLFTLILVTVAAAATTTTTAAANRIQNKAYAYYYCNSYCTQALNDENSCGYYDTDVSNQEYYACLCTKSSYYNNLRSCDCFTKSSLLLFNINLFKSKRWNLCWWSYSDYLECLSYQVSFINSD